MTRIRNHLLTLVLIVVLTTHHVSAQNSPGRTIPRKTGNMSVVGYHVKAPKGYKVGPPDRLLSDPQVLTRFGMTGIEDYVTYNILEPAKGKINPEPYLTNAKTCRRLGIKYAIYPWAHFYADWIEKEPGFTPYTNLENGAVCRQPSGGVGSPASPRTRS